MYTASTRKLPLIISLLLTISLLVACGSGANALEKAADVLTQTLDQQEPVFSHSDGISVALSEGDSTRVSLGSIPREDFLSGEKSGELQLALEALPSYLEMKSPLYTLSQRGGDESTLLRVEIAIPNNAEPLQTLDLYRWDSKAGKWLFVPGHVDAAAGVIYTDEFPENVAIFQAKAITPLISTEIETDQVLAGEIASSLNIVFPAGMQVMADGSLNGVLAPGWQSGMGYGIVPVIRADGATISSVLNNEASLALHLEDLQAFALSYNGIAVDYRDMQTADRETFTRFVQDLAAALDEQDNLLFVVLPAPTPAEAGWDTGGYDWRAIGEAVDGFILLTGLNPKDFAVDGDAVNALTWAVGEINRLKIHLSFSSLSVAKAADSTLYTIGYDDALLPLGNTALMTGQPEGGYEPGADLTFDLANEVSKLEPDQSSGTYTYKPDSNPEVNRVWIVTANTVRARLDLAAAFNIGGMVINDLLSDGNDAGMLTAINEFKSRSVSSVPNQLMIEWQVTGASGAILTEETGLGTPFVWQAGEEGSYSVQANIVGGRVSERGAVSVEVGTGKEAETPPPATTQPAEYSPPASTTEAPPPTDTPAPTSEPPASVGGAGSDGGALEYGGQVNGSLGAADRMHYAGMKWVKFQAKWPYVDPSVAGNFIQAGHAAGFKVLLSIPGPLYPTSIDFAAYTEHLRAVAGYQPDAIEVWNEMNIDSEWPAGQIEPASYVNNMLAPAFNAIKSVSPNTMVIIGALAPTGFDNGTNAWSDQRYLQGLAAAGAANYANCVGAHHNSGTTSPSTRSGRSEGDHYSWYFLPTIEVTYNSMGGALPVCVTEFGYVTPEGYGPLPSNFAWGADNTVAEQAAWLAEGIQISRSLGWVRLVVIWNMDFTQYDPDPQAGYAIIRPDGSCPACDSLAGVQ